MFIFFPKLRLRTKRKAKKVLRLCDLKNGMIYPGNSLIMGKKHTKEVWNFKDWIQA